MFPAVARSRPREADSRGDGWSRLAGALVLYGAPLSLAVLAALVYRTIAIAVPLLLAAVGAVQLRHGLEVTGASDSGWPATT